MTMICFMTGFSSCDLRVCMNVASSRASRSQSHEAAIGRATTWLLIQPPSGPARNDTTICHVFWQAEPFERIHLL